MAERQDRGRDECREAADHQRDGDVSAEHRAEQQRELDVPHPHALRIRERGDEEEAGGAERAERPLRARVEDRLGDERDGRGRHDDPVRDDSVLDVDRGEHDEDDAEDRRDERLGREPEPKPSRRRRAAPSIASTAG